MAACEVHAISSGISSSLVQQEGGLTSCSRVSGLAVDLTDASILSLPERRPLEVVAMAPPKLRRETEKARAVSTEQLWQEFMADPSQWWDNRFDKKNSRYPDFKHKRTKEALWIESQSNPKWVKAELAALTQVRGESGDGSNFHKAGQTCSGMAGLNQAEWILGQSGSSTSTSTITSAFEREPREGVHKKSSGTKGNVRTLCKQGHLKEAVHMLKQPGIRADSNTYVCLLQGCANMKALSEGKQVHGHILQSGFKPETFLVNALINMYAKCKSVGDARQLFDKMPKRDMFTWTMMMGGYAKHGHAEEALEIYDKMLQEEVMPDRVTFTTALSVCASLGVLKRGRQVHADLSKSGIAPDIILENTLIDMYAKCNSIEDARQVFSNMSNRDVVSWNAMIGGCTRCGCCAEAFTIYGHMQGEGVNPNMITFICVLNACATLGSLESGKRVHADISESRVVPNILLESTLVDMYAKCGDVEDARQVFDHMGKHDVVSWNAMIAGYSRRGPVEEAFKMYEQMQQEGVMPNIVTFICVLNACASLGTLEKGKQVHAAISESKIMPDSVLESTLVDMYAKCGNIEDARQVFNSMAQRDVVSWTAMIVGYVRCGPVEEAFNVYDQMQQEGVRPNAVTFAAVLNACASLGALKMGKGFHADISNSGIVPDIYLGNTLLHMYATCGSIEDAHEVFAKMATRNLISWNSMIAGYAQHGHGREALQLFDEFQQEGLNPDSITWISVLSACSHAGLVDEGRHYFDSMSADHGVTPAVEHFGCMVDLLGRAGCLHESEHFIKRMPFQPGVTVWKALLGACRIHGDVELAERAAKCILELEPQDPGALVLLSSIYAAAGRWDDKAKMRNSIKKRDRGRSQLD